jgi:hypothetical protein
MIKTKPEEPFLIKSKPVATETSSYPYHVLDDREFELLVYALYENEIEKGDLVGDYDDIWLMEGVREEGKDCSLYRKGDFVAVIQCKHRSKLASIGKVEVAKEIIKFLLHIINKDEKIANPFKYYFVVSSDFDRKSRELLEDFNRKIILEEDLKKWTTSVIKENKALSKLVFENIEEPLHKLLTSVVVQHKAATGLTLLLNKPFNTNIIDTFFTVKKVIDVTSFEKTSGKILSHIEKHSAKEFLSAEEIVEQFARSSAFLSQYNNFFFNLPDSHITRKETEDLYNWIQTPNPLSKSDDKILLLTSNAGYGKSVILRDLWHRLRSDKIPLLGIKADRYPVLSIKELEEKLDVRGNIYSLLQELGSEYERVVVLVDQVDALSQTLSSQRESLNAYNLFVNAIKEVDNIRIIISVRTFDLNYDPDLQNFKARKTVNVSLLSDEEVATVLKKIGVEIAQVSAPLKTLLRTPLHLNVFCKIFKPTFALETIRTLQDMYQLLCKQIVLHLPLVSSLTSASVKQCLQTLALRMNEKQQIALNQNFFADQYGKEIDYLSSEGVLTINNDSLEFFHQTFYDFVFAKGFVESGQSVTDYVLQNKNSLNIRSSLKMIMGFLREQDQRAYLFAITTILTSTNFLFHIKLLLYNILGFTEKPTSEELWLIQKYILPKQNRRWLFLESVYSEELLIWLIKEKVVDSLLVPLSEATNKMGLFSWIKKALFFQKSTKESSWETNPRNLCYTLLAKHLPHSRKVVVRYLINCPEFQDKPNFAFRLLYFVSTWDFDEAFQVFEKYQTNGYKDSFQFFHILQQASDTSPDWVIGIYKPSLIRQINEDPSIKGNSHDSYQEEQLFEKLFNLYPEKALPFAWEVLDQLTETKKFPAHNISHLFNDLHFYMYDYDRSETERGTFNQLYGNVIEALSQFQRTNKAIFTTYYNEAITSGKISFYKLLVYSFNEQTENTPSFKDDVFGFIKAASEKNALIADEKFEYHVRQALVKYFPYFTPAQKNTIFDIILSLNDPYELHKYETNGKLNFSSNWGLTKYKYFSSLPREEVLNEPKTRRLFQELERRYSTIKDTEPNKIRIVGVGAPLNKEAYENMSYDQWLSSFKKYDNDVRRFDDHPERGGLTENYRAFKAEVEKRPQQLLSFVERLFDEEVHPQYIVSGLDGLKSGKIAPSEFARLYKQAIAIPLDRFEVMQLIWMADYLIEARKVDEDILDFLIEQALKNPDPSEDKGQPRHEALNTVRGAATERLTSINFNQSWSAKIFDALEKATEDQQISVKVSLLGRLSFLMHLDKERTLSVFLKVIDKYQRDIYQASIWSAQYLAKYSFEKLHPYFLNFLNNPDGCEEIATIIAIGFLNKRPGSNKLLQEAFKKNDVVKTKIIHVGWNNIFKEGDINKDAAGLFLMGRNFTSDAITNEYSRLFLHWPPQKFAVLFPVIYKYSRSKAGKKELHYYYEYLLKCMKDEPEKCLQLISNIKQHEQPEPGKRMTEEEPVKLAIGLFNSLDKLPGKKKKAYDALRIFDQLLRDPYYRRNAANITEQADQ